MSALASRTGKALEARAAQRADAKDRLLAKKPRVAQIEIVTDDDLVIDHDRKLQELEAARRNGHTDEQVAALEKQLAKVRGAIEDATVVLKFRSIGAKAYDELVDAHPPSDEQNKRSMDRFGREAVYNVETFPPALIAASMFDPQLSEDEVRDQIWESDDWNRDERAGLFQAALDVNSRATRVDDLGKGSG